MPLVHIRLKCRKPKGYPEHPQTLGEHVLKRRMELGLNQGAAAKRLLANPSTVLNWETGRFEPSVGSMPAILAFLGYDPFPSPKTLGERLVRERRKGGWTISQAACRLGVDPATWRAWERNELIFFQMHRRVIAAFLGLDVSEVSAPMRERWNEKHRRRQSEHDGP